MPKSIFVDNSILTKDKKFTFLTSTATNGTNSLSVQSIVGFNSLTTSSGQIICIGELGNERSEFISTSSSTVASGTTVTLASNLLFDHPQDTKVYLVDWNRTDFQWSATATGTKSTLTAYPINIQADQLETLYRDTAQTTGFYFVRFNETIGNTNSDFSDPIPFGGFDDNTVAEIKKRALDSIKERIDPDVITHNFLNKALWQGRREYHQSPGKRPFRRKFNIVVGNVSTGIFRISLPADVEKPYTAENVYGVRIGTQPNMQYYDKKLWDTDYQGSAHSTLRTAYAVGDQDLYVTDTRNYSVSGSVVVEDDSIAYSAVGVSTTLGTLRISTQGKFSHANGSDVWQNMPSGMPQNFTVFADPGASAFIYFSSPISTTYVNQEIFADYYRTIVDFDSDSDALDEPDYDMFVSYLAWRIKKRKNKGMNDFTDPDYQMWVQRKANAIAMEYIGTEVRIKPNIEHLPFPP